MKCFYPLKIKNPDYIGLVSTPDLAPLIEVPCGRCYNCLTTRRNQWTFRLKEQSFSSMSSFFMTFTFSDEFLTDLDKKYFSNRIKLLRKYLSLNNISLKYYAIGEYGSKYGRPHYHMLCFLDSYLSDSDFYNIISRVWKNGFICIEPVSDARIHYITHYHVRPKESVNKQFTGKSFCLMSKGLGLDFMTAEKLDYLRNGKKVIVHDIFGNSFLLPRYYRKKFGIDSSQLITDYWTFGDHVCSEDEKYGLVFKEQAKLKKYNLQEKF